MQWNFLIDSHFILFLSTARIFWQTMRIGKYKEISKRIKYEWILFMNERYIYGEDERKTDEGKPHLVHQKDEWNDGRQRHGNESDLIVCVCSLLSSSVLCFTQYHYKLFISTQTWYAMVMACTLKIWRWKLMLLKYEMCARSAQQSNFQRKRSKHVCGRIENRWKWQMLRWNTCDNMLCRSCLCRSADN